jgi:hypothetical protein
MENNNLLKVILRFCVMEQIEKFTEEFFRNLKCDISKDGDVLVVNRVPKSFEDLVGKEAPYRLSFVSGGSGEFVGKGSRMLGAMTKFLESSGKTTLLKIDFGVDGEAEIRKRLSLKNCEIKNLVKKDRNSFFSRFTFATTFRYLNEAESVVNEIYVHEGRVVEGDLDGYSVVDGSQVAGSGLDKEARSQKLGRVKDDYDIARDALKRLLSEKQSGIGKILGKKADEEVKRIEEHYERQLGEIGGDLNGKLKKVRDAEMALRLSEEKDREGLRKRLDRLQRGLVKAGNDEVRARILKERAFTIKDAMHKFSLNVDNRLVNTTVIYYSVFAFDLYLSGVGNSNRLLEMSYDPLTRSLSKLVCEGCGKDVEILNLCAGGHISCGKCLDVCGGDCGRRFCVKCLKRSCNSCGRRLCKDCAVVCRGCGGYVCKSHMRTDCVSGDDRCVLCLRACLRCHGMAQERFFGKSVDGSKVCQKCLGEEKRGEVLDRVFER